MAFRGVGQRLPPVSAPSTDASWDDPENTWCNTSEGSAERQARKGRAQKAAGRPPAPAAAVPALQSYGAPRLEAICIGVLAFWVEELLDSGTEAISLLTADARAALLSVARSKGMLTDDSLALLQHEDWHILDVAHANQLSTAGLFAALRSIPRLSVLDLTGCRVSHDMLSQLGTLCPQLQVLRYGGDAAANSALTRALPGLLPSVVQPAAPDQLGESWEEAEDSMLCGMLDGRLQHLQYLLWPGIPSKAAQIMQQLAPRVHVNPDAAAWQKAEPLPLSAQQQLPADVCYRELVGQYHWQSSAGQAAASGPTVAAERQSLAELFKNAYVERDQRRVAKAERNYKQALARQWRASPSMRAIALAEAGVPLRK